MKRLREQNCDGVDDDKCVRYFECEDKVRNNFYHDSDSVLGGGYGGASENDNEALHDAEAHYSIEGVVKSGWQHEREENLPGDVICSFYGDSEVYDDDEGDAVASEHAYSVGEDAAGAGGDIAATSNIIEGAT